MYIYISILYIHNIVSIFHSCPPIAVYAADILDSQLNTATKGFINGNTHIDKDNSSVTVSTIFKWYLEDFGGSREKTLQWILVNASEKITGLVSEIENPKLKYSSYNWAINK
jgi:hypothetical protein